MKNTLIILLIFPTLILAQQSQKKIVTSQFIVNGNCEMCKKTIEKAKEKEKKIAIVNHWQLPLQLIATSLLSNISEGNNDVISISKMLMIMVMMAFLLITI